MERLVEMEFVEPTPNRISVGERKPFHPRMTFRRVLGTIPLINKLPYFKK